MESRERERERRGGGKNGFIIWSESPERGKNHDMFKGLSSPSMRIVIQLKRHIMKDSGRGSEGHSSRYMNTPHLSLLFAPLFLFFFSSALLSPLSPINHSFNHFESFLFTHIHIHIFNEPRTVERI